MSDNETAPDRIEHAQAVGRRIAAERKPYFMWTEEQKAEVLEELAAELGPPAVTAKERTAFLVAIAMGWTA